MTAIRILAKMEELVLMASILTLVIAFLVMQVTIVKQILMIVLQALVKMEELVLMASTRTLVIAFPGMLEIIVKQVTYNRYKKFFKV